ncbi:MAG: NYN domain-containing protein [Sphaerotilus sulfidivorans]|uniref:NYN domain-containing protein n=1 Tax=Sphaerotilus sulfidivorans TaxID=639200 RepID=UPI003F30BE34
MRGAARIAILIDGGFFLKRLPHLVAAHHCDAPIKIAACIRRLCRSHVKMLTGHQGERWQQHLHRIYYYDAMPFDGKAHHPVDNRSIDFAKSSVAQERLALFELLRRERKMALRLGKVIRDHDWTISSRLTKRALKARQAVRALDALALPLAEDAQDTTTLSLTTEEVRRLIELRDFWTRDVSPGTVSLGLRQKGVDMRIGLDISTLAFKDHVDTVVLVAGDSDFVPAAKLARREGIEFILDPLWQQISPDLHEHIDGLQSGLKRPVPISPAETPGSVAPAPDAALDGPQEAG